MDRQREPQGFLFRRVEFFDFSDKRFWGKMVRKNVWVVFSTSSSFLIFPKKIMGTDASEKVLGRIFDEFDFFVFYYPTIGERNSSVAAREV